MSSATYQLNEHFWTIQGEGVQAGRTAVFLRLQGCPVGCHWCDSKLTWYAGGEKRSVDEIIEIVADYPPADLLVITGGEPLLRDLDPLIASLHANFPERAITIETSGAYAFKGQLRPDWLTVSPKYAAQWRVAENILLAADELKYVVDETFTPSIALAHLAQILRAHSGTGYQLPIVVLMPEGSPPKRENITRALEYLREFPDWRFGPRLQYAYGAIFLHEGMNNKIVSVAEARARAKERARVR